MNRKIILKIMTLFVLGGALSTLYLVPPVGLEPTSHSLEHCYRILSDGGIKLVSLHGIEPSSGG